MDDFGSFQHHDFGSFPHHDAGLQHHDPGLQHHHHQDPNYLQPIPYYDGRSCSEGRGVQWGVIVALLAIAAGLALALFLTPKAHNEGQADQQFTSVFDSFCA
jgi:hypothetical protein